MLPCRTTVKQQSPTFAILSTSFSPRLLSSASSAVEDPCRPWYTKEAVQTELVSESPSVSDRKPERTYLDPC